MEVNPYVGVVVDLVDPYFTPEVKNIGGFKSTTHATNLAIHWIRKHPGRWALVGEDSVGLTKSLLAHFPEIEVSRQSGPRNCPDGVERTYMRIPHPEGESLVKALERRPIVQGLYIPELERDQFGWSKAELEEACRVARDNLFPVSGNA